MSKENRIYDMIIILDINHPSLVKLVLNKSNNYMTKFNVHLNQLLL